MNKEQKNVSRNKLEQKQKTSIEKALKYLNQISSTYKNLSKYQKNDQPQSKIYIIL